MNRLRSIESDEGLVHALSDAQVQKPSLAYHIFSRCVDLCAGIFGVVFLVLPSAVIVGILSKFDSPGPIFYSQRRVGKDGKVFSIWKYRTMRVDAEANGPQWAQQNDTRVTKLGKILRRHRIDEIPQLLNVLLGDMSLIGPRPERPEFERDIQREVSYYHLRHQVKPGITGWAQVNQSYGNTMEGVVNKLHADLYWIANRSIRMDLKILFKSVSVVITGQGAL